MADKIDIREAKIKDIKSIIKMAGGFHCDAIENLNLGYRENDFSSYIKFLIESEITVVFVLTNNSKIVGTISGIISPWFMDNRDVIITEQWIWIDKDHRGKGYFSILINKLIEWGKLRGANKLSLVSIGSSTEAMVRDFYKKKGFSYMETHFIKEI